MRSLYLVCQKGPLKVVKQESNLTRVVLHEGRLTLVHKIEEARNERQGQSGKPQRQASENEDFI